MNQLHARAVLDLGSMVTPVHTGVAGRVGSIHKTLKVVCIHGDTKECPLQPVTITPACGMVTQKDGVVPNLIHDIKVGRDCPLFIELWDYVSIGLFEQCDISVSFEGQGSTISKIQ